MIDRQFVGSDADMLSIKGNLLIRLEASLATTDARKAADLELSPIALFRESNQ